MKKGWLLTILSVGLIFGLASTTNAGFNFGIKSFQHNTESFVISGDGDDGVYLPPQIAFHVGATTGGQAVIFGGVELSRSSLEQEVSNHLDGKTETSFTIFSPFFGGKYYFMPISKGRVSLYVSGSVFKSFASVSYDTDDPDFDKILEEYFKELNSSFGFTPAFGAEYFFSDNFSLGGETGFKFTFLKAEVQGDDSDKWETKGSYIDHYIAITLNFFVD